MHQYEFSDTKASVSNDDDSRLRSLREQLSSLRDGLSTADITRQIVEERCGKELKIAASGLRLEMSVQKQVHEPSIVCTSMGKLMV